MLKTLFPHEIASLIVSCSEDVAKCRCSVARQLLDECQSKKEINSKNSLIVARYDGWLLYTAASADDLDFVNELLRKYPLLVFGEGEYGLTDILYAAARSKNSMVFKEVYSFAISPRFSGDGGGGVLVEGNEDVLIGYKLEVKNRAVHAAARGGNLTVLMELLNDCTNVLVFRDVNCSTILHSVAGKGQVEGSTFGT